MLVSQIGYIGCIITPTDEQLKILQSLIDTYVKSSTVIAADRLYLKPAEGGLGLLILHCRVAVQLDQKMLPSHQRSVEMEPGCGLQLSIGSSAYR